MTVSQVEQVLVILGVSVRSPSNSGGDKPLEIRPGSGTLLDVADGEMGLRAARSGLGSLSPVPASPAAEPKMGSLGPVAQPEPLAPAEAVDLAEDAAAPEDVARPERAPLDIVKLYLQSRPRALAIARAYLRNEDDAMDAVHEAFIKVHRHRDQFDGTSNGQTWLYRIVINVCLDMRRRRRRRPENYVDGADALESMVSQDCPAQRFDLLELRAVILDGLRQLREPHRAALVLRELSGFDYEEIAAHQQCPKGTVMSRLFHARRLFRQALVAQTRVPMPQGDEPAG